VRCLKLISGVFAGWPQSTFFYSLINRFVEISRVCQMRSFRFWIIVLHLFADIIVMVVTAPRERRTCTVFLFMQLCTWQPGTVKHTLLNCCYVTVRTTTFTTTWTTHRCSELAKRCFCPNVGNFSCLALSSVWTQSVFTARLSSLKAPSSVFESEAPTLSVCFRIVEDVFKQRVVYSGSRECGEAFTWIQRGH